MDTTTDPRSLPERLAPSNLSRVSSSLGLSDSPPGLFGGSLPRSRAGIAARAKHLKPFATEDIKILLLENVNQTGRDVLAQQGYQVDFLKTSLSEDELIQRIRWAFAFSLHSQVLD